MGKLKINNKSSKEEPNYAFRKQRKTGMYYATVIILIIFSVTFIYSAYKLFSIQQEYKDGLEEYDDLHSYTKEITPGDDQAIDNELKIDIDFEGLKAINSDIVGWIYFENVNINYPIVKGMDNSYYLKHTFKKEQNSAGSIFMDYRNNSEFKDLNTVIYGHNMRNGSMFGNLRQLSNEEIYKENSYFWILTQEGKYKCEIFSLYIDESTSESYSTKFETGEDYSKYLNMITEKSIYNIGIKTTEDDSVVTLSTCASAEGSSRFIVHGKIKGFE
jgi:sortase B